MLGNADVQGRMSSHQQTILLQVFDRSEALLERCGTGAQEDSYALEYDADRWLGLCCLSFKPVYK